MDLVLLFITGMLCGALFYALMEQLFKDWRDTK